MKAKKIVLHAIGMCGIISIGLEQYSFALFLLIIFWIISVSRFEFHTEEYSVVKKKKDLKVNKYSVDHSEDNWDMDKLNKRNTQCVDMGVRLDDYKILGQQLGFGICKATKLRWEHFDWVSLINESSHPIKKTKAYTFIGYRDERKAILLCEKIN